MIVVSMALIKKRIDNIEEIIESLLNQSLQPDKILIYVSKEAFHLDDGIQPKELPKIDDKRIEFCFVKNIGSLRKLFFTYKKYKNKPETKIILLDDDKKLGKNTLEKLIEYEQKHPNVAIGLRGFRSKGNGLNREIIRGWGIETRKKVDIVSSGWCQLIKPRFIDEETFLKWEKYKDIVQYSDEVFIAYSLAVKSKTKRFVFPFKKRDLQSMHRRNVSLWRNTKTRKAKKKQINKWISVITK